MLRSDLRFMIVFDERKSDVIANDRDDVVTKQIMSLDSVFKYPSKTIVKKYTEQVVKKIRKVVE